MQGQSSKGTAVVGSIEIRDGSPRLHRTCSKTQNGIGLGARRFQESSMQLCRSKHWKPSLRKISSVVHGDAIAN